MIYFYPICQPEEVLPIKLKKKKKKQEKKQKREQSRTCWYFHTEIHSIVILNVLLSKTNTEMAYFPLFYHKHTQTLLYTTSRKASEFLRDIGHIFWLSKNLRKIDVVDVGKLGMGSSSNKMLVLEILKYRGGLYFCKRHKLWKIASAPGNKPFFSLFFSAMTKCPTKSCIPSIARLTPQHIHTNCMGVLYIVHYWPNHVSFCPFHLSKIGQRKPMSPNTRQHNFTGILKVCQSFCSTIKLLNSESK